MHRRLAGILLLTAANAASAGMTLSIVPAEPRYLEPVHARITQTPYPTATIYGVSASMDGNRITLSADIYPDLGASPTDVMLGRFPAGTYTVTMETPAGPQSAQFTVAPAERSRPALHYVPTANYTDLWWDPAESGWGMSIHQGPTNEVFAVWFVYDAAGSPVWYTLQPGNWSSLNVYSGPIYRTRGPGFTAPFDPSSVTAVQVGSGHLAFGTSAEGDFVYTIDGIRGAKRLRRMPVE